MGNKFRGDRDSDGNCARRPLGIPGYTEANKPLWQNQMRHKLQLTGGLSGVFDHLPEFRLCLATA